MKTMIEKIASRWEFRKAGLETQIKDLFSVFEGSLMPNDAGFISVASDAFEDIPYNMDFGETQISSKSTGETSDGVLYPDEVLIKSTLILNFNVLSLDCGDKFRKYKGGSFRKYFLSMMSEDRGFREKFLTISMPLIQKALEDKTNLSWWTESAIDLEKWFQDQVDFPVTAWRPESPIQVVIGKPKISGFNMLFPAMALIPIEDVEVEYTEPENEEPWTSEDDRDYQRENAWKDNRRAKVNQG